MKESYAVGGPWQGTLEKETTGYLISTIRFTLSNPPTVNL